MIEVGVLGPTVAAVAGRPVVLGARRRRVLLARLVLARGTVVPVDRLVEDLWHDTPPHRPLAALHAYVSHLRRAIEPDRVPRQRGGLLGGEPPGYVLRLPAAAVDAWRFEAAVLEASGPPGSFGVSTLARLEGVLASWRGPAYAEVADEPWALAEANRLEDLQVVARERLCAALLAVGRSADVVARTDSLTAEHPLREEGWRLRALALYASGRQGDALAALRQARRSLLEELGVVPGPALVDLEADILDHRVRPVPGGPPVRLTAPDDGFVGRTAELDALRAAASRCADRRAVEVVLVSGHAGAGKSRLLERASRELADDGWLAVTGRCPEADGAPPGWAWTEILGQLSRPVPLGSRAAGLAPLLRAGADDARGDDPEYGPFLLRRALGAHLAGIARTRPLAVVIDDLHRADPQTADLLAAVCEQSEDVPLLVLAVRRPGPSLAELLDVTARSVTRIELGGLAADDAGRLIAAVAGATADQGTVTALVERTGGNALHLVESARLLAAEGPAAALAKVPLGVSEMVRVRCGQLGPAAVRVLSVAAVIGREIEVEVLLAALEADRPADRDAVLDVVAAATTAGLLVEPAPGRMRFAHLLIRDALHDDLPGVRRAQWHARIAAALAAVRPTDVTALAHHLHRAGTAATARAAVDASTIAAERATAHYAPEAAAEHYRHALEALERLDPGGSADAERVELISCLGRAQLAAGAGVAALQARTRATRLAARGDDDRLLLRALTAWDLPTPWTTQAYGTFDGEIVTLLERALRAAGSDGAARCRLLCELVRELAGHDRARTSVAADEAEALARALGDPWLLGLALHARAALLLHDGDVAARLPIADELLELADRPGQAVYALIAHEYRAQYAATHGDLVGLRDAVDRMATLTGLYRWRQSEGVVGMHRGLLAHLDGDLAAADEHYRAAVEVLRRNGGLDVDRIGAVAALTVALSAGTAARLEPVVRALFPLPAPAIDMGAVVLFDAGHPDEARAVRRDAKPVPHDFFRSLLLSFRTLALLRVADPDDDADRSEVEAVYSDLDAFAGQVAAAVTGAFALGPVDLLRGDLAEFLGWREHAELHYLAAQGLVDRVRCPQWADALRRRGIRSVDAQVERA